MNILVLNLGSSSFKFELFDSGNLAFLKAGEFEMPADVVDENNVQQESVDKLFREMLRQIGDVSQIKAVGHRVVHGGDKYLATQEINVEEIYELEKLNDLAPLHNPYNLAGIKSSNKYIPEVSDYAVFDTAFFKDLPDSAKIYPIPYKYYEEEGIRKFGFHGISHKYAGEQAAKKLKIPFDKAKLITVHLGGGCSVCAIDKSKPVDISMGFTPLEGLMMMTRAGDIDAGVIFKLLERSDNDLDEIKDILNSESGIKGISGHDDYLELLKAVNFGDAKSKLALEMFINKVKKYIGAYLALLGEVDAVVFTGKIGYGKPVTRKKICDKMNILEEVPIIVIEPHEELAIAWEVKSSTRPIRQAQGRL